MIQAIIFDCFGVLATEGWLPFKSQYFGHDPALAREAGDLMEQANAGLIDHATLVDTVADMAKITPDELKNILWRNVPNQPLFDYISQLKPDYKLGILSNSASDRLQTIFTADQLALFDAIVLSFETKLTKPDPQIYQLTAQKLGVEPSECVFIDDQAWYVTAAQELGMQGIQYQGFEQTQSELQQILAK